MNFLAVDVETANADYSSICQIGIAKFVNGELVERWVSLINPETYFDPFNTSIHGISEKDVKNSPTFDKLHSIIFEKLNNQITVHHMPFDRVAITRACNEYNLDFVNAIWLDSAKIVRRTWSDFSQKGYGLKNIANFLNIDFKHHDALEDAITAAEIVKQACFLTGLTVEDWGKRVGQPILLNKAGYSTNIKLDGNPDGPLNGETIVFTGSLFLPRADMAKIAANLGCNVSDSVTKNTTMLVVGIQDATKLAGYDKSSKHRKAEEINLNGGNISILSEQDFVEICNTEDSTLKMTVKPKLEKNIKIEEKIPESTIKIDIASILSQCTPQELEKLKKYNEARETSLSLILDISRDEKRNLTTDLKTHLEKLQKLRYDFQFEYLSDEFDIVNSIEYQIEETEDLLNLFLKDKISVREIYENLEDIHDNIAMDSEEEEINFPVNLKTYITEIIAEIEKMTNKIWQPKTK
ncbi:MAG TPA: exonuclease domain-containing protein [Leadbetterella sp.]|nr:exonuclease domain-containing protein [Leadbetterella sp.]